jgi:hypothetical protein
MALFVVNDVKTLFPYCPPKRMLFLGYKRGAHGKGNYASACAGDAEKGVEFQDPR